MPLPPPAELSPGVSRVLRLGIVAATVLGLARATQVSLGPLLAPGVSPAPIVVRAARAPALATDTGPGELWLEHLVVDGRLYRPESLNVSDAWRPAARNGAGYPMGLRLDNGADSGAVSFRGRRVLMVVDAGGWRGTIRVVRNGGQAQAVQLPVKTARNERVIIDDPAPREYAVLFLVALVILSAAAWRWAPAGPGSSGATGLLLALAALHLLFWLSQAVGTTNDSPGYLADSISILRDGWPTYFPPGYPVFLGAVGTFAGRSLGAVVTLLQHVMSVVTALWVYRLMQRIAAEELALAGGLLAGAFPPVLAMSQAVMTEIPTVFAMVGALYFAVRSAETGGVRFALLAGLLAGWGGILRVVPLAGLLPAIALVHFAHRAPRRWRGFGLTVGATAVVLMLPLMWFWYHSGVVKLADSTGLHLYNRVVTEQRLVDETAPATRELFARLGGDDPRDLPHWLVRRHPGMRALDYERAERLLWRVAMEGVRSDPWAYAAHTPPLAWRELTAEPSGPAWAEARVANERLESSMPLAVSAAGLRWRWRTEAVTGAIWPTLCWIAVMGVLTGLFTPHRHLVLALALVPTGYLLATASVDYFVPRHSVATVPFVIALALMLPASLLAIFRRPRPRPLPRPMSVSVW